jgi:polyhydroxyalkanoate synthesis repressor PhaR
MTVNEPNEAAAAGDTPPVIVKKYANRRLYNTESSSYITLDSLAEMVRVGRDFVVYDAKTGDDITRSVLTQIIVEEEGKGSALLPTGFLRQLIGFYGNSMQGMVPRYLEQALTSFGRQQQQMRSAMQTTMGPFFPFGIEEVGRQNMAMMERAMSLFTPFYRGEKSTETKGEAPAEGEGKTIAGLEDLVASLEAEVESLRGQLAGALVETARVQTLQDDLSSQKTHIAQLESELAAVRAEAEKLPALRAELASFAHPVVALAVPGNGAADEPAPVPAPAPRGPKRGGKPAAPVE